MANIFDQFDTASSGAAPQSSGTQGNIFDQFDAPSLPKSENAFHSATRSAVNSFGLLPVDDLASGLAHATANGINGSNKNFMQSFDEGVSNAKSQRESNSQAHPMATTAGSIAGFMGGMGSVAGDAPETLLGRSMQAAGIGAGSGAATGAIETPGDLQQKAEGAIPGAVVGGAIGAVLPPALEKVIIPGASAIYNAPGKIGEAVSGFVKPRLPQGQEEIAGTLYNNLLQGKEVPDNLQPAIQGLNLTPGEMMQDPNAIGLQRQFETQDPMLANATRERMAGNQQTLRNAVEEIGGDVENPNAQVLSSLRSANQSAKSSNQNLWQNAGIDNANQIPFSDLRAQVKDYYNGLATPEKQYLPKYIQDVATGKYDHVKSVSLPELQAYRSDLSAQSRQSYIPANQNYNANRGRILGEVGDILGSAAESPEYIGDATSQAYQAARQNTAQMKQTFGQKDVRNALYNQPESSVADQFIRSGKGAPEAFQAYLNALKGAPEEVRQSGYEAARAALSNKILAEASTSAPISEVVGENGLTQTALSAAKMRNAINKYQHIINSDVLNDAQRSTLNSVQRSLDMMNSVSAAKMVGNSNTPADLMGKKWLDVLLGKYTSGATKFLPYGDKIADAAYGSSREKILDLVQQATQDPDFARALQMKARPGNMKFINPISANKLEALLAAEGIASGQISSETQRETKNKPKQ